MTEAIVQVVVDAPRHAGLAAALDYRCERMLDPGSLVRVPLGRREVAGIVWRGVDRCARAGHAAAPGGAAVGCHRNAQSALDGAG